MPYIGDKSRFINSGLDEQDSSLYECPACHNTKLVPEEYSLEARMFFPLRTADTICDCGEVMDKVKEAA